MTPRSAFASPVKGGGVGDEAEARRDVTHLD